MASRVLLRLIEEAIVPAIIIFVAKLFAVVFLIQWLGAQWQFNTLSAFPSVSFTDGATLLFVDSYSNLFMFIVAVMGLAWVLTKAHHFHDTHISPRFVLQLLSWNLTGIISTSNDLFHEGVVWFSYVWLATLFIGLHVLMGTTFLWVFIVALLVSIVMTWFLVSDIEREVSI